MQTLQHQSLRGVVDRGGSRFEDMELRQCTFERCAISMTPMIENRTILRHVRLVDCKATAGCIVGCATLDSCWIENLRNAALIQCWATAFRHTTISGRIGRLMVSERLLPSVATAQQQEAAAAANRAFYAAADWAIDVSRAEFEEADLRGIPAHLIIRDSETQVVVTRAAAMKGAWRNTDLVDPLLPGLLQVFLDSGADAEVFVAARRSREFKKTVEGLRRLVDIGVATR
jgi:hypothetical protein